MEDNIQDILRPIHLQARLLGACSKFTGKESLQQLVALFKSPQGIEFCMKTHFPNMSTLRIFKAYGVERYGVHIDSGSIVLDNPEYVVLCGRTTATIHCYDSKVLHHIVLLHGAKAIVDASDWAVVKTDVEQGCSIIRNTSENAVII